MCVSLSLLSLNFLAFLFARLVFERVPGDIVGVNALKECMDKFQDSDNFKEPHVPASALKLWFRELPEVNICSKEQTR